MFHKNNKVKVKGLMGVNEWVVVSVFESKRELKILNNDGYNLDVSFDEVELIECLYFNGRLISTPEYYAYLKEQEIIEMDNKAFVGSVLSKVIKGANHWHRNLDYLTVDV